MVVLGVLLFDLFSSSTLLKITFSIFVYMLGYFHISFDAFFLLSFSELSIAECVTSLRREFAFGSILLLLPGGAGGKCRRVKGPATTYMISKYCNSVHWGQCLWNLVLSKLSWTSGPSQVEMHCGLLLLCHQLSVFTSNPGGYLMDH